MHSRHIVDRPTSAVASPCDNCNRFPLDYNHLRSVAGGDNYNRRVRNRSTGANWPNIWPAAQQQLFHDWALSGPDDGVACKKDEHQQQQRALCAEAGHRHVDFCRVSRVIFCRR